MTVAPLFHDNKEAPKEAMGRLYWMADMQGKTWKHQGTNVVKAHVYNQRVEELPKSQRVVYSKPAAEKCAHQHETSGKCSKHTAANPCAFWHWQHMPVGSVRPPLLTKRLATRRFIPVRVGRRISCCRPLSPQTSATPLPRTMNTITTPRLHLFSY